MKASVIQGLALLCAIIGVVLWLGGYGDIGIGVVIGGYIVYVLIRIVPRIRKMSRSRDGKGFGKKSKPAATAPTWESMRARALEALDRKIRGHKLDLKYFFPPEHEEHPVLVKVKEDITGNAGEVELKKNYEILKLSENSQNAEELLDKVGSSVNTAEELDARIKRLRSEAQP